jgi:hypothetical protein
MTHCKDCGKVVVIVPSLSSNVSVTLELCKFAYRLVRETAEPKTIEFATVINNEDIYISHFLTCRKAKKEIE